MSEQTVEPSGENSIYVGNNTTARSIARITAGNKEGENSGAIEMDEHLLTPSEILQLGELSRMSLLGTYPAYDSTHPWAHEVQEIFDVVSENDPNARVILLNTKQVNALSLIDNTVIITRGIIEALQLSTRAELAAVLGHEWIHAAREHARIGIQDNELRRSLVAHIGYKRRNEIEADLLDARHLDKLGINPIGIIMLLEKSTRYAQDQNLKGDFDHGSNLDRLLNMKEATGLEDVRHLSDPLHPIDLPFELLKDFEPDSAKWEHLEDMTDQDALYFAVRQMRKALLAQRKDAALVNNNIILEDCISLLKNRIIVHKFPELSSDGVDMLTEMVATVLQSEVNERVEKYISEIREKQGKKKKKVSGLKYEQQSVTGYVFDSTQSLDTLAHLIEERHLEKLGLAPYRKSSFSNKALHQAIHAGVFGSISDQEFNFDVAQCVQYAQKFVHAARKNAKLYHNDRKDNGLKVGNDAFNAIFEYLKPYLALYPSQLYKAAKELGKLDLNAAAMDVEVFQMVFENQSAHEIELTRKRIDDDDEFLASKDYVRAMHQFIQDVTLEQIERINTTFPSPYSRIAEIYERTTLGNGARESTFLRRIADGKSFKAISEEFSAWRKDLPAHLRHQYHTIAEEFMNLLSLSAKESHDVDDAYQRWYGEGNNDLTDDTDKLEAAANSRFLKEILLKRQIDPKGYLQLYVLACGSKSNVVSGLENLVHVQFRSPDIFGQLLRWKKYLYDAIENRNREQFSPIVDADDVDFSQAPGYLGAVKFKLFEEISRMRSFEEQEKLFSEVMSTLPIFNTSALPVEQVTFTDEMINEDDYYDDFRAEREHEYMEIYNKWYKRFFREVGKRKWDTSNPESLRNLFFVSCLAENMQVLFQVPHRSFAELVAQHSFEEGLGLLESSFKHYPSAITTGGFEHLVKSKARSVQDFEKLNQYGIRYIDKSLLQRELLGKAAIADVLSDEFFTSTSELLTALIQSEDDDSLLKTYVTERWIAASRGSTVRNEDVVSSFDFKPMAMVRLPGKEHLRERWLQNVPKRGERGYKPYQEVINALFLLDTPMKYLLMRKVLMGEAGVLRDPEKRKQFIDDFSENYVEYDNEEEKKSFRDVLSALVQTDNVDDLYLNLNPILMSLILKPSKNPATVEDVSLGISRKMLKDLCNPERKGGGALFLNPSKEDEILLATKIRNLMIGEGKLTFEHVDVPPEPELKLLKLFPENAKQSGFDKNTPWNLALRAAEHTPAGAKIMQKAQMYIQLPEDVREQALNVYDRVPGQSRLSIYRLLKREAENSPFIKQLLEDDITIEDELGAGSLFTVVRVVWKGERYALAARNPNAEYRSQQVISFYKEALDRLIAENPENNDYPLMKMLLDDMVDIIHNELHDEKYAEKNVRFREHNHHYRSNSKNRYEVYLPRVVDTGTTWVYFDEEMEGKNLTRLQVTDEETDIMNEKISRDDYKQVVNLLVSSLRHQVATGLVHSDFTPGQFMVMSDNARLTMFDKRNLIELSADEIQFFQNIEKAGFQGMKKSVTSFIDHMLLYPENGEQAGNRDEIMNSILDTYGDTSGDVTALMREAKRLGLHVPVHMEQILLNFVFLDQISQKAGFANLVEAFTYQSDSISGKILGKIAKRKWK